MAASPPSLAAPLAIAAPSVSDALVSENRPPATIALLPMYACEMDFWMLIATAAATLIGPPLVSAGGVVPAPPSPSPPFADDVVVAWLRSAATWLSTLCEVPGSPSSSGAPAALAVAEALEFDFVDELIETAPVALISRSAYASVLWLTMFSASAMPMAAVAPSVSPCAVVTTSESCDALMVTSPVTSIWVGPGFVYAFTVTLLMTTDTAGATATLALDAPVVAVVIMLLIEIA